MSYKGNDLDPNFVKWFRKEKKRIETILISKGCTNIKLSYGFHYFYGFFTSETGQVYYINCPDKRYSPNDAYMYRTAQNYRDFSGGRNMYIMPNKLNEIKLS